MDALDVIFSRRSIRHFKRDAIPDEKIEVLLRSGMAAPSTVGNNDWAFIVIKDKNQMRRIMEIKPGNADMLEESPVAVLICGDTDLAYSMPLDYWVQDCSAAAENMLIAATAMGIGSVWLGIYPRKQRVEAIKEAFDLPENIIPLCAIALGIPAENKPKIDRYEASKVHFDRW